MVNRYPAPCSVCGTTVPANGGTARRVGRRWLVTHLACADGSPSVYEVRTGSGWSGTRNIKGRCEDAPCCGCCTF